MPISFSPFLAGAGLVFGAAPVRFEPPAPTRCRSETVAQVAGVLREAGVQKFLLIDSRSGFPGQLDATRWVLDGVCGGGDGVVDFHFWPPVPDAGATAIEALQTMHLDAARQDGTDIAQVQGALGEIERLVNDGSVRLRSYGETFTGAHDLSEVIRLNPIADVAHLPAALALSKLCPVGPQPGFWHWAEPWKLGSTGDPLRYPMTHALQAGTDAHARCEMIAPTALVYLHSDFEWDSHSQEHLNSYWTTTNHAVLDIVEGPDRISFVVDAALAAPLRMMAAHDAQLQLVKPDARQPPVPRDQCSHISEPETEPARAHDPHIDRLARAMRARGFKRLFIGEVHGMPMNIRLITALVRGAKGNAAYFQEMHCTPAEDWSQLQLIDEIVDIHRVNTIGISGIPPDTIQEQRMFQEMGEGLVIHPMIFCFEHLHGSLQDFVDYPDFAMASVGLSHAMAPIVEPDKTMEAWCGEGRQLLPAEQCIPTGLRDAERWAAIQQQNDNYGGFERAMARGNSALFLNNEGLDHFKTTLETFEQWCSSKGWVVRVFPLGPDGGTFSLVGFAHEIDPVLAEIGM